jgi:hypothetical protein
VIVPPFDDPPLLICTSPPATTASARTAAIAMPVDFLTLAILSPFLLRLF